MKPRGLIDTGAILALLDRDDRWHEPCVAAFRDLRLPLATSAAVLAELFHLLEPGEMEPAWSFLRSGAVLVLATHTADLPELESLMKKYSDRPMDFADATLVQIARREDLRTVFTIDHNDFETYRIKGNRRFEIHPPRSFP